MTYYELAESSDEKQCAANHTKQIKGEQVCMAGTQSVNELTDTFNCAQAGIHRYQAGEEVAMSYKVRQFRSGSAVWQPASAVARPALPKISESGASPHATAERNSPLSDAQMVGPGLKRVPTR